MPLATVRVIEGVLDEADKSRLMERITDALVEIEGQGNPNFAQYCWVFVEEVPRATWGVGRGAWGQVADARRCEGARRGALRRRNEITLPTGRHGCIAQLAAASGMS
ncbi:MAG: tautomerase family protein [Pseudonocardiaceae bacterium]